jgi:hypothetical protein
MTTSAIMLNSILTTLICNLGYAGNRIIDIAPR